MIRVGLCRHVGEKQSGTPLAGRGLLLFIAVLSLVGWCGGAEGYLTGQDLTELSIEELMNVEVTSVSRRPQRISDTAAAVFVITQEDIRRSGVTSIPEALRMVPGMEVARINANQWAITCRGFNGRFANKLLVMIDGRSVYTPLFSGVYWDVQDTMLEDVERIEVIRGPGASLWGANAVNGVINVVTKNAAATQGGLTVGSLGTEERGLGEVRYGFAQGDDLRARAFLKYAERDGFVDPWFKDSPDDWRQARGGFRADWSPSPGDTVTMEGDIYRGKSGIGYILPVLTSPYQVRVADDTAVAGMSLLTRWKRLLSDSSDLALQAFYERVTRKDTVTRETRDTFDLDFQHHVSFGGIHDLVWGFGYRLSRDRIGNTAYVTFDPESRTVHLVSGFVQDDIQLVKDRLHLTVGAKFEHNSLAGFSVQPTLRLLWTPRHNQTLWASVSRAVRTPSRAEQDSRLRTLSLPPGDSDNPFPLPVFITLRGDSSLTSEKMTAYEVGYRSTPVRDLSLDATAFYTEYQDLRAADVESITLSGSLAAPRLNALLAANNRNSAESYGVEVALDWLLKPWWKIQAFYAYLNLQVHHDGPTRNPFNEQAEGLSPRNQASVRSSFDLGRHLELDIWLKYVDRLKAVDAPRRLDLSARLGWRPWKDVEFSLVGQNLLDNRHYEFSGMDYIPLVKTEVQRGAYLKAAWGF